MKRLGALTLALFLVFVWATPTFAAGEIAPPDVTAQAYLVMDADTGQILIEKNGWQRCYPASITKIMTIALAMEHCGGDLSQQVTVSYEAVHTLEYGSSHVALQPDEVVTLRDLFHATILASANDAANVLAEYTAGSMDAFADRMNEKAAELGMNDTHFVNASGLHDDAHYTTAHDMALLTRWAMTVPGFAEIFGATEYVMQPTNKQEQERRWGTDNCMLVENKYQYEGTLGGKSGWTQEARYTMVEAVHRGGRTLLCVVLHCDKKYDKFSDSIALLDYCFENFAPVTLTAQDLTLPAVPVYYDEAAPTVGSTPLTLPAEGCTVLLHSALGVGDIQAAFDVPERYLTGQPFTASMTLSLKDGLAAGGCMYAQLAQVTLGIDAGAVEALLNTNAKEFVDQEETPVWGILTKILLVVLGIVLVLAALIALRIAYVAWVKAQRRKRRRARRGMPQSAARTAGNAARRLGGTARDGVARNSARLPKQRDKTAAMAPELDTAANAERLRRQNAAAAAMAPGPDTTANAERPRRRNAAAAAMAPGPDAVPGPEKTGRRSGTAPAATAAGSGAAPKNEQRGGTAAPAASSALPAAPAASFAPPSSPPAARPASGARHAAKPFSRRKAPPRHARH